MLNGEKMDESINYYSHDELPPPKNPFLYYYRCFAKLFMIFLIGFGSIILGALCFTFLRIFVHPQKNFKKAARTLVSYSFKLYIGLCTIFGLVRTRVNNKEKYKNLKSCIVVANHPSALDMVYIISLVPNAVCVVNSYLTKTPLAFVIKQIYLVNSLDFFELQECCKKELSEGANIIIFPEGTRTPRHGSYKYKRGAARIALASSCPVQPIYIGGNDKYGLGKHDDFLSFNRTERWFYDFYILEQISMKDYENLESQIASRHITKEILSRISKKALEQDGIKL